MGAKVLPKLKMSGRSIEHKYHEGNVKRTLKRELKVLEIVEREEMVSPRVRPGTRLHWLLPEYTGRWSACVGLVGQRSGLLPG